MDRSQTNGVAGVVTGAASGVGRAIATALADDGLAVFLVDRDAEGGERAADEIREHGGSATFSKADVTHFDEVREVVALATGRASRIDVLVNAAGVLHRGLEELTADEVGTTIDVNLKGTIYFCQAVVPVMRAAGSGIIVNIASSAVREHPADWPAYVAAKSGVVGLTRSLANRLRPEGVIAFALSPGMVATPMGAQAFEDYYGRVPSAGEIARILSPEAVADVVVALTRPELRFASGTLIEVEHLGVEPLPYSRVELKLSSMTSDAPATT